MLLAELEGADRSMELLEEALREAHSRPALQSVIHCRLAWASRFRADRDHAAAALELADRLGDETLRTRARAVQAVLGWLERAAAHAAHSHDIAIQYGLEVPHDHLPSAVIAVHRGELDLARAHSERASLLAERQFGFAPPQHLGVLGLVALWGGDRDAALAGLERADLRAAQLGWKEPSVRWWSADHVELLLELGRLDEAARALDPWEEDAQRVRRVWVLAHVTRCRGLLAAARGDVEDALAQLTGAVEEHEEVGDPFGRARALLALGIARRRLRQKVPAGEAIAAAIEGFDEIGALRWAAKARGELSRLGGRRRAEGLTPAERRVATLVAEGQTNREV